VSERRPELPGGLDEVIARAMAKDPRKRFRSPGRLMRAAAEALGVEATVPVLVTPRPPDEPRAASRPRAVARPRRARTRIGIGVVVPAVALCGLAVGLVDWSGPPAPRADRAGVVAAQARQAEQARVVEEAVERLAARRVALRRELASARRPAGQAAAAGAMADAYGRAREALGRSAAAVPAAGPIGGALRDTESAYRRLARTARAQDRRAWRLAVRETRRSDAQLERALRSPEAARARRD
jgi:hypothetical protein